MASNNTTTKKWFQSISALILTVFLSIQIPNQANAQIQLQIGGDEAQLKAMLVRRGYDRVETKRIKMLESEFYACKGDVRYIIDVKWDGRIKETRVGSCRVAKDQQQIARDLTTQGYSRISIEERSGKYRIIACKDNVRFRLVVNSFGDVRETRRVGYCERSLSPTDVTAKLEKEGYNRINFIDRQLPTYVAEACQKRNKFRLALNEFGQIQTREALGKCRRRISSDSLVSLLEEKGFTRIVVTRNRPPRYQAIACRDFRKVEVSVNEFGQIVDEFAVGRCERAFTKDEITTAMKEQGYKRVSVTQRKDRTFEARGCVDNRLNVIVLTKYGKLVERTEKGSCDSPKMHKLADILRDRGIRDLTFFVEGCESGRKSRITFDEYANRIDKKDIGGC